MQIYVRKWNLVSLGFMFQSQRSLSSFISLSSVSFLLLFRSLWSSKLFCCGPLTTALPAWKFERFEPFCNWKTCQINTPKEVMFSCWIWVLFNQTDDSSFSFIFPSFFHSNVWLDSLKRTLWDIRGKSSERKFSKFNKSCLLAAYWLVFRSRVFKTNPLK